MGYIALLLPEKQRNLLKPVFDAPYGADSTIQHHVTYQFPAEATDPLPVISSARIVGVADDGIGLRALIVEIDGDVHRPDGKVFHITWSLDRASGRRSMEANVVIAARGWEAVPPIDIDLEPSYQR